MSTTKLKLIALVSMLLAHIYTYIPNMPIFFHWIGRIAFPIFLFTAVWGFHYTSNRKKYIFRIYIFSVLTNIIFEVVERYCSNTIILDLNIFRTYFSMCIIILLVESYLSKDKNSGKYLICYLIWNIFLFIFIPLFHGSGILNNVDFLYTITGSIINVEGGLVFIILGVGLYFTKHNKILMTIYYLCYCFIYENIYLRNFVPRLTTIIGRYSSILDDLSSYFFEHVIGISPHSTAGFSINSLLFIECQWMMLFALPLLLLFNNEKGRGYKYLFYIFYPLHIVIVYYIGSLV